MAEQKFAFVAFVVFAAVTLTSAGLTAACFDGDGRGDCRNDSAAADDVTAVPNARNETRDSVSGEAGGEHREMSKLDGKGSAQGTRLNDRDTVYKMLYETFSFPESTELDALRASRFSQPGRKPRARKKRSYQELRYRTVGEDGRRTAPNVVEVDLRNNVRSPTGLERAPREAHAGADPPWHEDGKDFGLPVQDDRWEKHVSGKARDTQFLKKNLQAQLSRRKQQWRQEKQLRKRNHLWKAARYHRQ